jgi:hypothetical protein
VLSGYDRALIELPAYNLLKYLVPHGICGYAANVSRRRMIVLIRETMRVRELGSLFYLEEFGMFVHLCHKGLNVHLVVKLVGGFMISFEGK